MVSRSDCRDSCYKSQDHQQQENHPAPQTTQQMGHYLCVGHLIQILIGHVNHEGVNPCRRGKKEDMVMTPLILCLQLCSLWNVAVSLRLLCNKNTKTSHSPRSFFYSSSALGIQQVLSDMTTGWSLLRHLFLTSSL